MDIADAVSPRSLLARGRAFDQDTNWLDCLVATCKPQERLDGEEAASVRATVALRPEQIEAAEDLVHRRYAWRGYSLSRESRKMTAPRITLLAESADSVLGTLTVHPGGVTGLFAQHTYGAEIHSLWSQGRSLGEVTRLAVEQGAGSEALETLIRGAYVISRFMYGLTDVVIEVNPRHVRFYERILGFIIAASERFCERVQAPSVLMVLDLERFGRRVKSLNL